MVEDKLKLSIKNGRVWNWVYFSLYWLMCIMFAFVGIINYINKDAFMIVCIIMIPWCFYHMYQFNKKIKNEC